MQAIAVNIQQPPTIYDVARAAGASIAAAAPEAATTAEDDARQSE